MSETPGPRALQEFAESLAANEKVAPDVADAVARLLEEGTLTAAVLVAALRDLRAQKENHGEAAED